MPHNHPHHHTKGVIYALMAYTVFVTMDICIKRALESGLSFYILAAATGGITALITGIMAVVMGRLNDLRPHMWRIQITLGLISIVGAWGTLQGLAAIPLILFYPVIFTAPFMAIILSALWLKEPTGIKKILAIVVGFIGVIITVKPWAAESMGALVGYLATLASAFGFAISIVLIRKYASTIPATSIMFYSGLITVFGMPILGLNHHTPPTQGDATLFTLPVIGWIVAAGLCNQAAVWLSIKSTHLIPISTGAPLQYSQLITGGIAAYLIWGDKPDILFAIGSTLIVASGLYVIRGPKASGVA